jgi:CSLREA domain-containing protein
MTESRPIRTHAGRRRARIRPDVGLPAVAVLAALVLAAAAGTSSAKPLLRTKPIVVDTTADGPDTKPKDGVCKAKLLMLTKPGKSYCTLRAAIQTANLGPRGSYVIELPAGTFHLSVPGRNEDKAAKGDLDVLQANVTVVGKGPAKTTIDAGGTDRVFDVSAFAGLKIVDLRITGGTPGTHGPGSPYDLDYGGGVRVKGTLQLRNVLIENSSAEEGGAIEVGETGGAELSAVTLLHNVAGLGAGIAVRGNASLTNVTIAGNNATSTAGGAIVLNHGKATLLHVTIAGNTASGSSPSALDNSGTVMIRSSIVQGTCVLWKSGGHFPSPQRNVVESETCGDDPAVADAGLLSIGATGNVVPTIGLKPTSPAVDFAFPDTCPPVDARGVKRPQGAGCDAGAYELVP